MLFYAAIASAFLVSQISAGLVDSALIRRENKEELYRRYVDDVIEPVERVKRQTSTTASGSTNASTWDATASASCVAALEKLTTASNPSGLAVCYNVPSLDNTTGVFEADLRLYNISPPTGAFADIAADQVMVGLSFAGATVQAVNASTLKRSAAGTVSLISWPRDESAMRKRVTNPTLVQDYAFVGQVDQKLLTTNMDTATWEALLTPVVTLTGTTSSGATTNTTLSSNEASFVAGVFSSQATTITKAAANPPIQTLVVAADAPFVVPGTHILIFPIGGVITGIWTILFIGTIAWGTVGRMQFRDQFRQRTAREAKQGLSRI